MPHLILEASSNIIETNDKIKISLQNCQQVIVESLDATIQNCTSRAVLHDLCVIGDGSPRGAFLHLTVKLLKGRSPEKLSMAAKNLQQTLKNDFQKSLSNLNLNISVEIVELSDHFVK